MQTKIGAVIIYDAAYEAYISEDNVAHTIYECEGAKNMCDRASKSFSKNAGFTGVRLGIYGCSKRIKMRRCFLKCNVGKTSWNKVQRCTLYRSSVPERQFTQKPEKHS